MRIKWLKGALASLAQEADRISFESPYIAELVVRRIRKAVDMLAQTPEGGRSGHVPGTRELFLREFPYVIAYQVVEDSIIVLRVHHLSGQSRRHRNHS